jgi:hypothetical protein
MPEPDGLQGCPLILNIGVMQRSNRAVLARIVGPGSKDKVAGVRNIARPVVGRHFVCNIGGSTTGELGIS